MLHGYKKSKYNIYDNLEFLGLNPYEQKHFCFGEGGGNGDTGGVDEGEPTSQEAQDEQDEAQGIGIDEAEATNLAGLIDDLAATNNLGALDTGYQGISAEDKASGLQDAMDRGDIGYNQAVEAGFVGHVEQAERDFDLALARSIADKYGLNPSQVQPGFMQDPTLGPQTMSYRGPGAAKAAATEIGKAAAELGITLAEMYPSPLNMALTVAKEEGLVDVPSLGLKEGISGYFDELAASQREANMAARGELSETVAAPETLSEQVDVSPQSSVDYFDAPPQSSVDYFDAPPSQPQSSVDYFDALIDTTPTPSPAKDLYGDTLDGNEIISRIISKTPTTTPVVEKVDIAAATPRTITPATDTFSILANIYGPEVAEKLLPTRIV